MSACKSGETASSPRTVYQSRDSQSLPFIYLSIHLYPSIVFIHPIFFSTLIPPLCSFVSAFFPYSLHFPFANSHSLFTASYFPLLFLCVLFFFFPSFFSLPLPSSFISLAVSPSFLFPFPNVFSFFIVLCLSLSSFSCIFHSFFFSSSHFLLLLLVLALVFPIVILLISPLAHCPSLFTLAPISAFCLYLCRIFSSLALYPPPPQQPPRPCQVSADGTAVHPLPTTNEVRHLGPLTYRMFALLPTVGFSLSHPAPPDLLRHRPRPAPTSCVPPCRDATRQRAVRVFIQRRETACK